MNHSKFFLTLIVAFLSVTFLSAQTIWYVNDDNAPGGDGTSWATAFNDLQTAIMAANTDFSTQHIYVAMGTYKPTASMDRGVSFFISRPMKIYGGFPNTGNPTLAERDPINFPTILSGDIGIPNDNSDNSYHVVHLQGFFNKNTNSLDGLIIQDGNANGDIDTNTNPNAQWHWKRGGGLFIESQMEADFTQGIIEGMTFILSLIHI